MNYRLMFVVSLVGFITNVFAVELPPQPQSKPEPLVWPSNRFELRGCIRVDNISAEKVPEYRIYYQGKEQRSTHEGFFSLPLESGNIEKYSLVICKKIDQQFQKGNTVDFYGVIPDKDYRYFSFRPGNNADNGLRKKKSLQRKISLFQRMR